MPLFVLSLEPGSDIYLYQETLYWSESCRRRLRKTVPCGVSRDGHSSSSSMSPTLLVFLHLLQLHLSDLSFMIVMPNRCCILELRANQCFVCNFLIVPRKPIVLVALAEFLKCVDPQSKSSKIVIPRYLAD